MMYSRLTLLLVIQALGFLEKMSMTGRFIVFLGTILTITIPRSRVSSLFYRETIHNLPLSA